MTVTYTAEVATCRWFGCFLKLLLRWRGSIYKLVWLDLTGFLTCYYILNIIYRNVLNESQKRVFEGIAYYCAASTNLIPLSFVLGFYVTIVMNRWWNQYISIPWPDPIAVFVSANIHGQDERGRLMRRTVMRYVCLCLTMVLTNISPRVKKRFPTLDNLVESGLLVENEKNIIEDLNKKFPRHSKHWLPIVWAASIITRARKEGRIRDDFAVKTVIDELNKFRGQCGLLISYDTISIPLVYTQTVTLATYSYFLTQIMGQQWIEKKEVTSGYPNIIDLYFPLFTTLQFFFYMGWLKVAESLINPFGEDDDDFEVNWMVDRNLQVSYLIVDEMHHEHPELIKDQYWEQIFPNELPYTVGSERFREEHPEPSTAKIEVSKQNAMPTNFSSVRVDEMVGNKALQVQQQQNQPQQQARQQQTTVTNYKFPEVVDEEADDAASGIHFTAGNGKTRHTSTGSSPSLASLTGTLSRVNTVASALKRFLSRDDSRPGAVTPSEIQSQVRLPGSASSASIAQPGPVKPSAIGSMKIADQVIEEVDEQMTITSMRGGDKETRPTAQEIFQYRPLPASAPLDIPYKNASYSRTQSATGDIALQPFFFSNSAAESVLSTSAPARERVPQAISNITDKSDAITTPCEESKSSLFQREVGTSTVEYTDGKMEEDDEFEKLRVARERERIEKQKLKIARSISTQPVLTEGADLLEPMGSQPDNRNLFIEDNL